MTSEKKTEPNIIVIPESAQSAPQFFAEGMVVMIGIPMSKIQFHSTVGMDSTGKEIRQITYQTILGTSTLIEFCQNALNAISENEKTLSAGLNEFNSKILGVTSKKSKS